VYYFSAERQSTLPLQFLQWTNLMVAFDYARPSNHMPATLF
jgi:hypothetical protein